jgi:hypothetical protein
MKYLSIYSIFLLTWNRFFALYFPNQHENYFSKKASLYWIFGFDLVICLVHSVNFWYNLSFIYDLVIMFIMSAMLISLFVKIRKNVIQLKSFDLKEKSTLNNMRRAANVCLIDTCLILLYLIPLIYSDIFKDHYQPAFDSYIKNDSFWSEFYIYAFSIIGSFYGVFYTLSVMLDVVITCYILRSYRSTILRLFAKVKHMRFSSNTNVSSVNIFVQRSQAGGA